MKFINIDQNSRIPEYQQIIDSVVHNISIGKLEINEKIPSIYAFSEALQLSKDTVEKAYNILRGRNIIKSIQGKGFFINGIKPLRKLNILFLINKMSWYKMEIYYSFLKSLGPNACVDLDIYHCDESLFLNLMENHKKEYDYYVIMPHFKTKNLEHTTATDSIIASIGKIPRHKLVVMGNGKVPFEDNPITVYEDYEHDIFNALNDAIQKITKYKKIILIYPSKSIHPYPKRIARGFKRFCTKYNIDFDILDEIHNDMVLLKGDLFITIEEYDLVNLIRLTKEKNLILGEDIGVISYNETPLKELLDISTISTDFKLMGETTAKLILENQKGKFKVPFRYIDRESM